MSEFNIDRFIRIYEVNKSRITVDSSFCYSILLDCFPAAKKEVHLISSAVKLGIPQAIRDFHQSESDPFFLKQLQNAMENNLGLSESSANWAVMTWVRCLRGDYLTTHSSTNQNQTSVMRANKEIERSDHNDLEVHFSSLKSLIDWATKSEGFSMQRSDAKEWAENNLEYFEEHDFELFKKLKHWSMSSYGFGMDNYDSRKWAEKYLEYFEKHDFELFKKLKQWSMSSGGFGMDNYDSRKWAEKYLEYFEKHDFDLYMRLKQFAHSSSGLGLDNSDSRKWADKNLEIYERRYSKNKNE